MFRDPHVFLIELGGWTESGDVALSTSFQMTWTNTAVIFHAKKPNYMMKDF